MAPGFVSGKGQTWIPTESKLPQLISKTFVTGDYVGDPYTSAIFGAHLFVGSSVQIGEILTFFKIYLMQVMVAID